MFKLFSEKASKKLFPSTGNFYWADKKNLKSKSFSKLLSVSFYAGPRTILKRKISLWASWNSRRAGTAFLFAVLRAGSPDIFLRSRAYNNRSRRFQTTTDPSLCEKQS